MRSPRTTFLTLTVFMILIGLSHGNTIADVNRWNAFNSAAYTQGFVRQACPGQVPCQDDVFTPGGNSTAGCPTPAYAAETVLDCHTHAGSELAPQRRLSGFAGHVPGPGGDVFVGTRANVNGERVDDDLFTVTGEVLTVGIRPGTVEVAVFRFFGDPYVFDGLEVDHVQELVDLGIIDSDDILAVETFINHGDIDMQVQVTGLSDDDIIIFAAGDGSIPPMVPATNIVGVGLLLLVMLGLGSWALLRRRNEQAD